MKRIVVSILFIWTAGFFIACTKENTEETLRPEGKCRVTLNIDVSQHFTQITRAVSEDRLFNLYVMVFDHNGVLFSKKTSALTATPSAKNTISLSNIFIEDGCRIYAIGNIGHSTSGNANYFERYFEGIVEESDLFRLTASCASDPLTVTPTVLTTATQAYIMTAQRSIPDISAINDTINMPMRRVSSKLRLIVNVRSDALSKGMTLDGVRVVNMPSASYILPRDADTNGQTDDYVLEPDEYYVSDWYLPTSTKLFDNNASPISLFENHSGTGPNKSDPSASGTPPAYATYVNIAATYNNQKYIYKVYLGNNNSTDYNVDRNTFYTLTVNIDGISNITSDVRVTPYDDNSTQPGSWYITDGMLLHYDGIKNNGDDPRVTNSTADTIYAFPRPALANNVYNYAAIGGYKYIETNSPRCNGKRNRWRNIAPATKGRFNMPIWHPTTTNTTAPNTCWGADCFMPTDNNSSTIRAIGSMEFDDDLLRPTIFTIECVFMPNDFNVAGGGNDLFAFFYQPIPSRYVTADVEVYRNGMGMIAGANWNGQNFGTQTLTNMKRRVVIQFDGQKLIGWYGREIVYTEPKNQPGDIPWARGALGATGAGTADDRYCAQLNLGTWARHNTDEMFRGKIYAFRFYNRLLTKAELDVNFDLDKLRFGLPEPK